MSCTDITVYDFSLFKGDDKTKKFRFKADEVPVDITGYVIQLETNTVSLQKTAIVADPTTGEFFFVFAKEDTSTLISKRVKYKVVFYPTGFSGEKNTKFCGSININTKGIL